MTVEIPVNILSMPKTKLVATLGPASRPPAILRNLIESGVDVFRLNMAHGSLDEHSKAIHDIRNLSRSIGRPVGILVDLAGPKIRLGNLQHDPLVLNAGQEISFVRGIVANNPSELTSNYEALLDELKVGDEIVLSDGQARLQVVACTPEKAVCQVIDGGSVRSRQGVNLPGTRLSVPALGEQDRQNAKWAAQVGADFVSLSFVRKPEELDDLRQLLRSLGSPARLIAKIEKREALDCLQAIICSSDAVMVARGDLGLEIALEKTPLVQKQVVALCQQLGKPVIVATQMLESMHHSKIPTRAEVSDVANAILDGADACMLSGETAIGEYPLDAVRMMKRIMHETEALLKSRAETRLLPRESEVHSVLESVMLGAVRIANDVAAKLVLILTAHSTTALVKSKQRNHVPTVCLAEDQSAAQRMTLLWGIIPIPITSQIGFRSEPEQMLRWATHRFDLQPGDKIVMILDHQDLPGQHDMIAVAEVTPD